MPIRSSRVRCSKFEKSRSVEPGTLNHPLCSHSFRLAARSTQCRTFFSDYEESRSGAIEMDFFVVAYVNQKLGNRHAELGMDHLGRYFTQRN